MPPKTKKGAEEEDGADLGIDEKYLRAQLEVDSLQRELGKIKPSFLTLFQKLKMKSMLV